MYRYAVPPMSSHRRCSADVEPSRRLRRRSYKSPKIFHRASAGKPRRSRRQNSDRSPSRRTAPKKPGWSRGPRAANDHVKQARANQDEACVQEHAMRVAAAGITEKEGCGNVDHQADKGQLLGDLLRISGGIRSCRLLIPTNQKGCMASATSCWLFNPAAREATRRNISRPSRSLPCRTCSLPTLSWASTTKIG